MIDTTPPRDVVHYVEQQAIDDRPLLIVKSVLDAPSNPARRKLISSGAHVVDYKSEFALDVPARRNLVTALLLEAEASQHLSVLPEHLGSTPLKLLAGPLAPIQPGRYRFPSPLDIWPSFHALRVGSVPFLNFQLRFIMVLHGLQ